MREIDLVVEGERTKLTPVDGTAEAWRLQLEHGRPAVSRLIGAISWTVPAFALVDEVPQLIALIGAMGADFDPPFTLPGAAHFTHGMAAFAAVIAPSRAVVGLVGLNIGHVSSSQPDATSDPPAARTSRGPGCWPA